MIKLIGIVLSALYLGLVLLASELIRRFVGGENGRFVSRKTVHILTCFLWFVIYYCLRESYYPIALCAALFVLLLVFRKRLPAISDSDGRASGALLYAGAGTFLCALCCLVPSLYIPLGITMCALSLGDGFAGLMGKFLPLPRIRLYGDKTLVGSFTAFLFVFLTVLGFAHAYSLDISVREALVIAAVFAFIELVTPFSADNITTSLATFLLSVLAINTSALEAYAVTLIAIPVTAVLVIKKKALTIGGVVAALAVAFAVVLGFGDFGFILLLSFFLLTTVCDLVGKKKKVELLKDMHDKPFGRGAHQVLAVGLIPSVTGIIAFITHSPIAVVAFGASVAESLGDCMASEIGVLSKKPPFDIFKRERVAAGMSGGVSLLGSAASLVGVALSALIYFALPIYEPKTLGAVITAALLGVIADTLLGSAAQRKGICRACGKITEKKLHCGLQTEHCGGFSWLSNTAVNLISNAFSAIMAALIYIFAVL